MGRKREAVRVVVVSYRDLCMCGFWKCIYCVQCSVLKLLGKKPWRHPWTICTQLPTNQHSTVQYTKCMPCDLVNCLSLSLRPFQPLLRFLPSSSTCSSFASSSSSFPHHHHRSFAPLLSSHSSSTKQCLQPQHVQYGFLCPWPYRVEGVAFVVEEWLSAKIDRFARCSIGPPFGSLWEFAGRDLTNPPPIVTTPEAFVTGLQI